jgi:Ca-activated chloride channel family protein
MIFARSEYLNLLWLLPVLGLFFYWAFRNRRKKLAKVIDLSLAPQLAAEYSRARAICKPILLMGFFGFSILAAARPQWGARLQTVRRQGVDIIAALDSSYSMNAEDVAPSRLEKAKGEIRRLLDKAGEDRIGLISFSGKAFVQCPLTLDHGAALLFLDAAATGMIPESGTSLASAIETAVNAFIGKDKKYKVLVLFTDGEDLAGQVAEAAAKAKEAGVIIYTVGVGTPQGSPIAIRDDKGNIIEYRKDSDGKVVVSSLDERSLAEVALKTGGRYFRASTTENEIEALYDDISRLGKKELESKLFMTYEDQFQVPLALAILFLAAQLIISEKRKSEKSWFERFRRSR